MTEALIRELLPYTPTGGLIVISGEIVVLTMALVIGIGILSGFYPAWRAARVRPLESIRSERE